MHSHNNYGCLDDVTALAIVLTYVSDFVAYYKNDVMNLQYVFLIAIMSTLWSI